MIHGFRFINGLATDLPQYRLEMVKRWPLDR
jgi:hypothetical protein